MEAFTTRESDSPVKFQEVSLLLRKYGTAAGVEGVVEEAGSGEDSLETLQTRVDELQESYDEAVMEKYSLAQTCQQVSENLKSANYLLDRSVLGLCV